MELSSARANFLVEKLVKLVARAFYSDTYIVVLDAFLREKYIRYEELGPRLKLGEKDVNAVIQRLEGDMLVRFEDLQMDEGEGKFRMAKCYYINYQQFVNVVRFRVRRMQEAVASAEKTELDEVFYQCPTCQHRYSSLEAQRQLSADLKFVCTNCCPFDRLRDVVSQDYFRLVEIDKRAKLDNAQVLHTKLHQQLHNGGGEDSLFELLQLLKDVPLIDNLPSENRKRGIKASQIDKEAQLEMKQKLESVNANSLIKSTKRRRAQLGNGAGDISVTVANEDYEDDGDYTDNAPMNIAGRATNLPEFLQNSRVRSAEDIMRESAGSVYGITTGGYSDGSGIGVAGGGGGAASDIATSSSAIAAYVVNNAAGGSGATSGTSVEAKTTTTEEGVGEEVKKTEGGADVAAAAMDEDLDDIDWEEG